MFLNENDLSLFISRQRIIEAKNKCNFANILGIMEEKRVTKRLEKVTKRGFFYGIYSKLAAVYTKLLQ